VRSLSTAQSEHRYFTVVAVSVAVIVLAGFVPMYTLRLLHHDPNLTILVHAHGFVMSAWIALFLFQVLLIARRRIQLHRRLGTFGVGLAALIVLLGVPTLIHSAARQAHCVDCSPFRWRLVAFDGLALFVFSCLVSAAILLWRRADYHKRLMLLATLSLLGPAFGRLTAIANGMGDDSDVGVLVLCAGIVVVCATVDTVKSHRLHPAFLWGGVAIICMDGATYLAKMMI
jgi:hypothetical protein